MKSSAGDDSGQKDILTKVLNCQQSSGANALGYPIVLWGVKS